MQLRIVAPGTGPFPREPGTSTRTGPVRKVSAVFAGADPDGKVGAPLYKPAKTACVADSRLQAVKVEGMRRLITKGEALPADEDTAKFFHVRYCPLEWSEKAGWQVKERVITATRKGAE